MARLLGPDPNTRTAWRQVGGYFKTAAGGVAVFYADAAGSVLADIRYYDPAQPTVPQGAISGSALPVDYKSEYPIFWFPDAADVLYVSVDGGPLTEVHAGYDARLDALALAAAAAETTSGAQAKANAAQTAAIAAAASDATTKANAAALVAVGSSLQKSANLADLASASAARTNLVLGNSATRAVGTTAGTVAAGDDSRFSASAQPRSSLAGGRSSVGVRLVHGASVQAPQNAPTTYRTRHITSVQCSDLRLVYSAPHHADADGATQPIKIKCGIEYSGTVYPVTFNGQQYGTLDPAGIHLVSDPAPVELPAGATFYVRCYVRTDFGSYVTLSPGGVTAGATTLSLSGLPGGGLGTTGLITIESPREQVTVLSYSGSSAPYTANLSGTVPSAHSAGSVVGGTTFTNAFSRSDYSEGSANGQDYSWVTTAVTAVSGAPTTTLVANANPGDTFIQTAAVVGGTTYTIGAETLTVRNVGGTANPWKIYLTAPVAGTYASGTTVTGSVGTGSTLAPTAVVADRVVGTAPASIVVIGDSIPDGTGYNLFPHSSYMTDALNAANRPYWSVTKAGESAQQFAAPATSRRRKTLTTLAGWCIYTYGVNDIYGSRSLAQVQADTATILGWVRQRGLKVAVATLTPRTTSTDSWATTGNQSIVNPGTHDTVRKQYNAWVRAGADGLADMVLELADATETARDSGIWKADASGPYSVDGIHPSYAGHTLLMKPVIDAALPLLT